MYGTFPKLLFQCLVPLVGANDDAGDEQDVGEVGVGVDCDDGEEVEVEDVALGEYEIVHVVVVLLAQGVLQRVERLAGLKGEAEEGL